jgi:hypothetical protein
VQAVAGQVQEQVLLGVRRREMQGVLQLRMISGVMRRCLMQKEQLQGMTQHLSLHLYQQPLHLPLP